MSFSLMISTWNTILNIIVIHMELDWGIWRIAQGVIRITKEFFCSDKGACELTAAGDQGSCRLAFGERPHGRCQPCPCPLSLGDFRWLLAFLRLPAPLSVYPKIIDQWWVKCVCSLGRYSLDCVEVPCSLRAVEE